MASFAVVLDSCRVNASTIYAINFLKDPSGQNSFDFGLELVLSFVLPYTRARPSNSITTENQAKINNGFDETIFSPQTSID